MERAGLAEAVTSRESDSPRPQQFVINISPMMTDDTVVQLSLKCRSRLQISFSIFSVIVIGIFDLDSSLFVQKKNKKRFIEV